MRPSATARLGGVRGLELAVGGVFVALLLRHWFRVRFRPGQAVAHGPEWLELAAAGILALEAYHLFHRPAPAGSVLKFHILPWLYGAVAIWYALMAFHLARPANRLGLHFTADGFWLRRWALGRAQRVRWVTLRALAPVGTGADLLLHLRDKSEPRRIGLHEYMNGSELSAHLIAEAAAHGVEILPPDDPSGPDESTE